MSRKPRIAVLNGTCLDVVEEHRAAIEARGVELWADQAYRKLDARAAIEILRQVDGVILPAAVRTFPQGEHMAANGNLLVCAIAASGYEWLDVEAASRSGVVVTNAVPPEGTEVVADLAFGLMIAVARQIPFHHQSVSAGRNDRGMGFSLWKKTLGIVGLGKIGKAMARRARGFDMRVLAATPNPDKDFSRAHDVEIVSLEELFRRSDFVSLHVRLTEQTRNMIGGEQLALMKPTAFLINTARRELVDEGALTSALIGRKIAGAGLDDPPINRGTPLLNRPNVVFTPHLGNRAVEGVHAVFLCAMENALAVLHGQRPPDLVNPEVYNRGTRKSAWAQDEVLSYG